MSDEAMRAYFKSQGWPHTMNGTPKTIAQLDHMELRDLARKYAILLQTEFRNISPGVKPVALDAPIRLMQAHAPAALAGIYFEEAAKIEPAAFKKLTSLSTIGGRVTHTAGKPRGPRPELTRVKRGHGPRKIKLTPAMIHYMTAVERDGSGAWDRGAGRAGGAVSRLWDRLVAAGLATPPPRKLTAAGRAALKAIPIKHQRITPAAIQRMASGNHNRSSR